MSDKIIILNKKQVAYYTTHITQFTDELVNWVANELVNQATSKLLL